MAEPATTSVLFLCLGNICRSPMAEAVFTDVVQKRGLADRFRIDSCGTGGYHIGEAPDSRSTATCNKHGVKVNHKARRLSNQDYSQFDWILCMDEHNLRDAESRRPAGDAAKRAKLSLFGAFDPQGRRIIEDPYYGGQEGFETNFQQVTRCSDGFLAHLGFKSPL
ncbi:LMWPc-domain-containing protein [Gonapodya prolifera JEL478]|uniref:LMWPc-domain-containing protein n=1 Tax=Gonapodya prolifera (strain JEL478) TaxID=1344416 RepID=A0A139AN89_GONPJ|nr:LMWPc-domain-containing protein [Gonapodya prolifera JEL478]|eukprot:KXS18207.1 LMWPc-domain-containing protein [Gonapodya prolifera JEL478]